MTLLKESSHSGSNNGPSDTDCDPSGPMMADPQDCHFFSECVEDSDESGTNFKRVTKTCGDVLMFNPYSQDCDWPQNVGKVRPQCKGTVSCH